MEGIVLIRGSGDIASGVAHRLKMCGFDILMTDIEKPTFIRRAVCFGEAIYEGSAEIEGIKAKAAKDCREAWDIMRSGVVAVMVDEDLKSIRNINPCVLVDAIIAKKNVGTYRGMARLVIGLGPGFYAGQDVDVVVETNRGHNLGKVIEAGPAEPNTGVPGDIAGYTKERIIRAPAEGVIKHYSDIGDIVEEGDVIGSCGGQVIRAPLSGIIRGFVREGLFVKEGFKIGDVDPRGNRENCYTISDKARSIAGGVLEAILRFHIK